MVSVDTDPAGASGYLRRVKATDTPPMEPTIRCPDPETYDLAVLLFEKLRFETNLTDDEVDLVSLLDCLIQDERGRRHPTP